MTGQNIFDLAILMMDEQNESTGNTATSDTKVYALRSVDLINTLGQECYTLSDTCPEMEGGKRPVFPRITALSNPVDLDDYVAGVILPYGLVYLLLQEENPEMANTCLQRFQELKAEARRLMPPVSFEDIETLYGGIEHGQYGAWL